jgi:hypothetical protein
LGLGLGAACYPGSIEGIQEADVIVTTRDTATNFAQFLLYAMPDSVWQVDDTVDGVPILSHDFDSLMIATVEQNLAARGYVRVNIPDNPADLPQDSVPNFLMVLSMYGAQHTQVGWVPGWGWGWPGWGYWPPYGPGWGWGSPGYWYTTSYETGTVFMDWIDPNNPNPGVEPPEIPIEWTGALRGLLGGNQATTATRLVDGINQAFRQSLYLTRN